MWNTFKFIWLQLNFVEKNSVKTFLFSGQFVLCGGTQHCALSIKTYTKKIYMRRKTGACANPLNFRDIKCEVA